MHDTRLALDFALVSLLDPFRLPFSLNTALQTDALNCRNGASLLGSHLPGAVV